MARVPLETVIRDRAGRALSGRGLFVYDRGTTVEASVYTLESGGSVVPQPLTSDPEGRYPDVWLVPGAYDLFSPDDEENPTQPIEAVVGVDSGTIGVLSESPINVDYPEFDGDIQAALYHGNTADSAWVVIPGGEREIPVTAHPTAAGYYAGLWVPQGTRLSGVGRERTILKLPAGSPGGGGSYSIIKNLDIDDGDDGIVISDLTVDGQGALQDEYVWGINLTRVQDTVVQRVRVKNVFGDDNGPPGETFHIYAVLSHNFKVVDCEVVGDAGTQGSGFGTAQSTDVLYERCLARGMTHGFGWAEWKSRGVRRVACTAQLNFGGFNDEDCETVMVACRAGGLAGEAAAYPYGADADLGNDAHGIINNSSVLALLACESTYNGGNGLVLTNDYSFVPVTRMIAGRLEYNDKGVGVVAAANGGACHISRETVIANNITAAIDHPTYGYMTLVNDYRLGDTPPAVPASGSSVTNNYPFDVTIYIVPNTLSSVEIEMADGGTPLGVPTTVRLRPSATIKLTYSGAAPIWVWTRGA